MDPSQVVGTAPPSIVVADPRDESIDVRCQERSYTTHCALKQVTLVRVLPPLLNHHTAPPHAAYP